MFSWQLVRRGMRMTLTVFTSLLLALTVPQVSSQPRADVLDCVDAPCAPPWVAAVLVFVTDEGGAPIRDASVGLEVQGHVAAVEDLVARTDVAGMAAICLEPGSVARLELS